MRNFLVAAVMVAVAAGVHAAADVKPVVEAYLQVQAALASDTFDGVKPAAAAVAAQAEKMGPSGASIAQAAKAVQTAGDMKAARAAFGDLSDAVIAAAKAEGWKGLDDVKIAYCPMAKESWLQKEEKIRNPYYGSSMLSCGSFQER